MSPHTFMTTAEVAEELRCSVDTVQRHIQDGSLPALKCGGRWLVARETVLRLHAAAQPR